MILTRPASVPHICMVGILRKLPDGPLNKVEVFLDLPARYRLTKILARTSAGLQVMMGDGEVSSFDFKHHFIEYKWSIDSMVMFKGKTIIVKATYFSEGFTYAP